MPAAVYAFEPGSTDEKILWRCYRSLQPDLSVAGRGALGGRSYMKVEGSKEAIDEVVMAMPIEPNLVADCVCSFCWEVPPMRSDVALPLCLDCAERATSS